jgi:DMSO/TMAO reductase YedYZ molybdopterin-dependent catalytic subunit
MKHQYKIWIAFFVMIMLVACAPAVVEEAVIQVGEKDYSQAQLEALGVQDSEFTNRDGEVTTFSGTSLRELLANAGIDQPGNLLIITAADDYEATVAVDEVLECDDCILAFDNESLRLVMPEFPGNLQVKDVVRISLEK